ncbi:MAG: ABC transporter permease [Candidatus Marinimicrobia bacterium]|nr:ABC transporter permease [Candidatus Neomarinimicrobiota bacterium]
MSQNGQSYKDIVIRQFKKNTPAVVSVYVIFSIFTLALTADFIANDKPLTCTIDGERYFPVFKEFNVKMGFSKWQPELLNADWKNIDYESAVWPLVPYLPTSLDYSARFHSPRPGHWLGTDQIGRDVLSGMIHGTRTALAVGLISMGIAILIGVFLGAIAGYFGGFADMLLQRIIEIMMTIPTFFLIVTVVAFYPGGGIWLIMVIIGLTSWPGVARFTRAEFLKVRNMDYVTAAEALGFSSMRTIFRHVLPNAIAPVLVIAAFGIASAILTESGLSFLGFGSASTVSWGSILSVARGATYAWWMAVFPGTAIFITVTVYNLLGEGLRDALDPRLK